MRIAAFWHRARTRSAVAVAICVAMLTTLVGASSSVGFQTGFMEDDYVTDDAGLRDQLFDKTVRANASIAKLNLSWLQVVDSKPVAPASPADPAYDFSKIDAAVRAATHRGLEPLIMIHQAPAFAEGPQRPAVSIGTWKPDPSALADFAQAVATRYSGSFAGLPRVRDYEVWNEPNYSGDLTPQREGDQLVGAEHFRRMVNAFYGAVKGVHPDNVVVTGGTGPYGDDSGTARVRPLDFLRTLLCLREGLRGATCNKKVHFDVLAHHPINTSGGPTQSAIDPDDASTPDLQRVRRTLRAAERFGTAPRAPHPLWATEIWWESDPPDTYRGVPLRRQARWIEQTFYVLWKDGADVVINYPLHDAGYDPDHPLASLQSGVYTDSDQAKPAAVAFAFPFVADRRNKNKVLAWGKAPASGKLRIQLLTKGHWRQLEKLPVHDGEVFTEKLRLRGKAMLRARIRGEKSLIWKQKR